MKTAFGIFLLQRVKNNQELVILSSQHRQERELPTEEIKDTEVKSINKLTSYLDKIYAVQEQ